MIIQGETTTKMLTRELAKQFATMAPLPGERELKPGRLAHIAHLLTDGLFLGPVWAQGLCKADGIQYRLDGQHTSKVLSETEEKLPNLIVTILNYEFDSVAEDAPKLFDIFNHPFQTRTDLDKLSIYRAAYDDLPDLDNKFLEKIMKGIRFYEKDVLKKPNILPKREKGHYLEKQEYREFASWLWKFHDAKHGWLIGKEGIVAEILDGFVDQRSLAGEFWGYVLFENHPEVDHITRDLSTVLREWTHSAKRRSMQQYHKQAKRTWDRYRRMCEMAPEPSSPPSPLPAKTRNTQAEVRP